MPEEKSIFITLPNILWWWSNTHPRIWKIWKEGEGDSYVVLCSYNGLLLIVVAEWLMAKFFPNGVDSR